MENQDDSEKGSSGVVAQVTAPDLFSVETGEGKLRVEIDGRVIYGKRVTVRVASDNEDVKVSWDELKPGHLYVDRHIGGGRTGEISGVLQVRNDGTGWRWVWTPFGEGVWGEKDWCEMSWNEGQPSGQRVGAGWVGADAAEAELVGACATDDEADARAVFTTWADSRGERLRQAR